MKFYSVILTDENISKKAILKVAIIVEKNRKRCLLLVKEIHVKIVLNCFKLF